MSNTTSLRSNNLTFVVGSGRCGTTLTRSLFESHPNVEISPELRFFQLIYSRIFRFYPLDSNQKKADFVNYIFDKMDKFGQIDEFLSWSSNDITNEELKVKFREYMLDDYIETNLSNSAIRKIMSGLVTFFSTGEGANFLVITPNNLKMIPTISAIFPDAKFINLIRDGRDVVTSMQKGERAMVTDLKTAALYWSYCARLTLKYKKQLSNNQFRIKKFESLINNPKNLLENICKFIGVTYHDSMLENVSKVNSSFQDIAEQGFDDSVTGRYQTQLSEFEYDLIMKLSYPELHGFQYVDSNSSYKAFDIESSIKRQVFFLKENFKTFFKRQGRFHWIQSFFNF